MFMVYRYVGNSLVKIEPGMTFTVDDIEYTVKERESYQQNTETEYMYLFHIVETLNPNRVYHIQIKSNEYGIDFDTYYNGCPTPIFASAGLWVDFSNGDVFINTDSTSPVTTAMSPLRVNDYICGLYVIEITGTKVVLLNRVNYQVITICTQSPYALYSIFRLWYFQDTVELLQIKDHPCYNFEKTQLLSAKQNYDCNWEVHDGIVIPHQLVGEYFKIVNREWHK